MGISTLIALLENCFAASSRCLDSPKILAGSFQKKPIKPAQGLIGGRLEYGYEEV
jgi:hypothetical protein